ncbi:MAG: saccharopine dehydrogenase C-terminal domain-containing protein [bacterium]|nr:saccharopine dehydrogenase C-terminal domain-containing protein [bacterium]
MKTQKKIVVLGAGMVGKAIIADLCVQHKVIAIDRSRAALKDIAGATTIEADLSREDAIKIAVRNADLVISAVPGFMGYATLRAVIEAGKNVVDISFFGQDPFSLQDLAEKNKVVAGVDCGVAPGMSNLILGFENIQGEVESFECLVGGLPKNRQWPLQYKAPFSPIDVIEEYTRPARLMEGGRIVTKPALSDSAMIEFDGIGTLEAFNTDGLRTLLKTMGSVPNMREQTLRYPGHIDLIKALQALGFFDKSPTKIGSKMMKPIDFTSGVLLRNWRLEPGEEEFTVMRITIVRKDESVVTYSLYDEYDHDSGITSMARVTGYAATAMANLILRDEIQHRGICPPEYIGTSHECFKSIMDYLWERGVKYIREEIPG